MRVAQEHSFIVIESASINVGDSELDFDEERMEADLMRLNGFLQDTRVLLDEDQMIMTMLEEVEVILKYGLYLYYYTIDNYNTVDEWWDPVETYMYTTETDEITARMLFERFEEALDLMEDEVEYE